jgi:hypothetical protein
VRFSPSHVQLNAFALRSMLFGSLRHEFDPLDREILERAFYAAWAAIEEHAPSAADERLAAILRCKLIEVADTNCLKDADALRDIVFGEPFSPVRS